MAISARPTQSGIPFGERPFAPRAKDSSLAGRIWSHSDAAMAVFTSFAIAAGLGLRFVLHAHRSVGFAPLWAALVLCGIPLLWRLARKVVQGEFSSDLLAGLSILTAVLLGEYLVAAIVVLMLSGGESLEAFATRRASSVLEALARRMPQTAHRKTGASLADVRLEDVQIGDTLVVFPHEICPVDGSVVEGNGVMDESYLTGEPFEISKTPGSQVISGAVNENSALTIVAEKLAQDSRYARIMKVMQETEQKRPHMRRLADRLGAWYTPAAVTLAAAGWVVSGDPRRFLAVIVIATPCPLLIAIPVAVIGAISLAARRSIIIKNPVVLEQITACSTMIFDKTGTLTYGRPALTDIIWVPGWQREAILCRVASLEVYSKHPLAGAIVAAARAEGLAMEPVSRISEKPGEGLRGIVDGHEVLVTGRNRIPGEDLSLPPPATGLECLIFVDGRYAAVFRFHDEPRTESRKFVGHLASRHQIGNVMVVSGDRESEVRYLAELIGISGIHAGKTPEEKVEIVREAARQAKTLFVGDGINDAPALQAATVGVAFGAHSDITSEAADAVILTPSLEKVDELMHIGRRMRAIALQSAVGGMALSLVGMILAVVGYLPPLEGAVAQEFIDLFAVLNAVRMALPFRDLTDY